MKIEPIDFPIDPDPDPVPNANMGGQDSGGPPSSAPVVPKGSEELHESKRLTQDIPGPAVVNALGMGERA